MEKWDSGGGKVGRDGAVGARKGAMVNEPNVKAGVEILVFDRTPLARLVSCTAAFGSAAIFFAYLSSDDISVFAVIGLGLLVAGTVLSALLQYGDHIYMAADGLMYQNRFLPIFGSGSWMRWDEVAEIREIQRKILVLLARDGRRILVDAVAGYAIARREILRRAPHAAISGTLTREDREC